MYDSALGAVVGVVAAVQSSPSPSNDLEVSEV